jgi:hypothetical protein
MTRPLGVVVRLRKSCPFESFFLGAVMRQEVNLNDSLSALTHHRLWGNSRFVSTATRLGRELF